MTLLWVLRASFTALVLACGISAIAGCGSPAPEVSSPAVCEPLPPHPIIARAPVDALGTELLVTGEVVGQGESDRYFQVIDAHLMLASSRGPCLRARVPLGELTRVVSQPNPPEPPDALELEILRLGEMEMLLAAVAFERVTFSDGSTVVLVHLMRDVKWGLTERYAVPVTIRDHELLAGDRVHVGRDSVEYPVYFGTFEIRPAGGDATSKLILERQGQGDFAKRVVFEPDESGALRIRDLH